jgi:hypothetical protein
MTGQHYYTDRLIYFIETILFVDVEYRPYTETAF